MKRYVMDSYLSETELHPGCISTQMKKWYRSIWKGLKETSQWKHQICPACKSQLRKSAFDRFGFQYQCCENCATIYLSPIPEPEKLKNLTIESNLLLKKLLKGKPATYKKKSVYQMREDWVNVHLSKLRKTSPVVLILEEDKEIKGALNKDLKEYDFRYACLYDFVNWSKKNSFADIVIALDVIEHYANTTFMFHKIVKILKPGGIILIATRCGSGFDIQILGQHSDTIYPFQHKTLISVEGMRILAKSFNLEIQELSTPGLLDMQIIQKAALKNNGNKNLDFFRYLFKHREGHLINEFQVFLQKNLLSSHLRAVLKKPE